MPESPSQKQEGEEPKRYTQTGGALVETTDNDRKPSGDWIKAEDYDRLREQLDAAVRAIPEKHLPATADRCPHCGGYGDVAGGRAKCHPCCGTGLGEVARKIKAGVDAIAALADENGWRCYWCNATFTDRAKAEIHFGAPHMGRDSPECLRLAQREARDWKHRAETAESELEAVRKRTIEAEKAITEHNSGCLASCAARDKQTSCDAYTKRGRICVDCPRDWMIEYLPLTGSGE